MENLTLDESAKYMRIVQEGNMDDMFDFAFNLGWKKNAERMVAEMNKFTPNPSQP